ncbi:alpha/beta hydrolase [Paramagnetospirillum kuznetsovii]|uniref:Alpha/beta hydrolase n=1 Tax=Paramagnetospirillum kuznetsovii TaxID=2053833 RepID=A0A364NWU0_9PROT|nr:alpha/beta fold hydrolase [Paramagnetospirillum kuznetsovii]RAU21561.1 alpha/beta hydrolase [Paramagnetospirillum kuznetsovii]
MTTTLILLPGLLNDSRLWRHQARTLSAGREVLFADLTQDDSLSAMAERVLAVAPRRFCLAGLSMGGYACMEIMRRSPERVERLALLDTTARPDLPDQTQRRLDAIGIAKAGGFDKIMPTMLPNLLCAKSLADAAITTLAKDMARTVGRDAFVRQQTAIMGRPDSRESLASVRCPTLLLCGAEDALTPLDRHQEMAALIPGSTLVSIPDSGHLAPLENPDAVTGALLRWLEE